MSGDKLIGWGFDLLPIEAPQIERGPIEMSPEQRSKIGEWLGAAFEAWRNPPQRWDGSIHMAWGSIDRRVVDVCRKQRTDGVDGIIRELETAGFRAQYDPLSRCIEVYPIGWQLADLREEAVPWIRGACARGSSCSN